MKLVPILLCAVMAASASAQNSTTPPNAGWVLRSPAQGAPPCRAIKFGTAVNTQLIRSRDGGIVLAAGHSDWPLTSSQLPVKVSMSVDSGSPTNLEGYQIGRLLLVKIATAELQKVVKGAHAIHWHLPWGEIMSQRVV